MVGNGPSKASIHILVLQELASFGNRIFVLQERCILVEFASSALRTVGSYNSFSGVSINVGFCKAHVKGGKSQWVFVTVVLGHKGGNDRLPAHQFLSAAKYPSIC